MKCQTLDQSHAYSTTDVEVICRGVGEHNRGTEGM